MTVTPTEYVYSVRAIIFPASNIVDEPVGSVFDTRQFLIIHCFYGLEYKFPILSLIGVFS